MSVLSDAEAAATIPASDFERAKAWYSEKLGLKPEEEDDEGAYYRCGGSRFLLFPSMGAASGTHTQMTWEVQDIEAEIADLRSRGVVFEEYDYPNLKTENGIAVTGRIKGAWFKDSEGNLLAIGQRITE